MATDPRGYWTDDGGRNLLKGVPGDVDNPVRMPDDMIIHTIRHSREARFSFDRVFPGLLQEEQDRLTTLIEDNPYPSRLIISNQTDADRRQTKAIKEIPVRTTGPRGGVGPSHTSVRR